MKLSLALALVAYLSAVSALPVFQKRQAPQQPIDDVAILQFALSLENLEAEFYVQGLDKFSEADFRRENIPDPTQTFQNLHHILQHEVQHVKTLQAVITSLGGTPVPPCEYQFPFQTARQFLAVANSLEKVGVSAYNGAVALLQNGDLQTAAATIDTIEARHASFLQTANGGDPFPENFDVALDGRQIITLASPFIKQCSFDLGFVPFGTLQVKNQINLPDTEVEVAFQQVATGGQNFCNWLFAEQSIVVPLSNNLCAIPPGARGDVYLMITNDQTPVSLKKTDTIVAGPAIVTIDTAHTDSCKKLFSGKKLSEGKLNQPIDHGPIPFNDPAAHILPEPPAGLPPADATILPPAPPAYGAPPSDVSATPPFPGAPPADATILPPAPPAYGAPPSEVGATPPVPGAPPSVVGAVPPGASVPIDIPKADPPIKDMFAEIQACLDQFNQPPSTPSGPGAVETPVSSNVQGGAQPPVGGADYASAPPTGAPPPVDPATGLPAATPPVDSLTVPAAATPPVDPATGLPAATPPVDSLTVPAAATPPVDPATAPPAEPSAAPPPADPATAPPPPPEDLTSAPTSEPVLNLDNSLVSTDELPTAEDPEGGDEFPTLG